MQDWLAARARVSPQQIALITPDGQWTYAELDALVSEQATQLPAQTRLGVLLSNSLDYVVLIFAAMRRGCLLVPLNTRLTWDEIKWQLHNADCSTLIAGRDMHETVPYPIDAAAPTTRFYLPKVDTDFKHKPRALGDQAATAPTLNDPFVIVHTSGTSGQPKGAQLTYGTLFYSAMASAYRIGHLPDDRWLCVLPMFHVGGLSIIVRAVLYGITVELLPRFNVEIVNQALRDNPVSLVSLVPTMLYRLLDVREGAWNPKLRLVLLGGAAATPELMQRCLQEEIPVATTYGLSEASSQVATTLPGDAARKAGTVGKPLMFTQVRVVDEHDVDVPQGVYGEIVVQGPTVMRGYVGNSEATQRTLRGGWLHTGDIGYLDADGDLWLVQRRSDLIITGGENVYPAEVEAALRLHPAIDSVAVIGLDDPEWGQRVAAAIVLKAGATLTADAIETHARAKLAAYKIPRLVRFVASLPLTESGKVQRPAVRALFD